MGADPNQTNTCLESISRLGWPVSNSTILFRAAVENNVDLAHLLIRKGANVNFQNNFGLTPLHYSARVGHVEMSKFLIDHGANFSVKGINRLPNGVPQTPAELAKEAGFDSLAQAIESNAEWESILQKKECINLDFGTF